MGAPQGFLPESRAERTIALARLALAACSVLALSMDPTEPTRYANLVRALTIGYTAWAVAVLVLLVYSYAGLPTRWKLAAHAVDLAAAVLFMNLTHGTTSPFFLYLAFALMAATLRWDASGALWTGGAVMVAFLATIVAEWVGQGAVELNVAIIRGAYLAVLTLMLAYLGHFVAHVRTVTQRLRAWQPAVGGELSTLMGEAVRYAADVMEAPRAVIVWEEPEEPGLRMAWWADGRLTIRREDAAAFQPLVADALARADFLCADVSRSSPSLVFTAGDRLEIGPGPGVAPEFVRRFAIRTLVGVQCGPGRLFIADKAGLTTDDLWLAQTVARQIAASLEQASLLERLEEASAIEARAGVARDLHDGLLQSLTAITLRLHTIAHGLDVAVRERIEALQTMIGEEARRLRRFIQDLSERIPDAGAESGSLAERLQALAQHVERDWDLRVQLMADDLTGIPAGLRDDVYFVVREALINAARHAEATVGRVAVALDGERVCVTVVDNGRGFPFEGRSEGLALATAGLVPRTLYGRITSLGGHLVIDSGRQGSRVEVTVPIAATTSVT